MRLILKHAATGKVYIDEELEKGKPLDWKSNEHVSQGVRAGLYGLEIHSGEQRTNVKFYFYVS